MWTAALLANLIASTAAVPTATTVSYPVALSTTAPDVLAATAAADAIGAGARRFRPIDGARVELQPGGQFDPSARQFTSPAAQLVVEGRVSLLGLGGGQRALGEARAEEARASSSAAQQQHQLLVTRAWFARRAAELDEKAAAAAVVDATAVRDRLVRLTATGSVGADDVAEADAFVAELVLLAHDAEARRLEAGLTLARLLGADDEVGTAGELPVVEDVLAVAPSSARRDLEVAQSEARLVAQRQQLSEHDLRQAPSLGVALASQIDDARTGFVYGRLALELPSLDGDVAGRAALLAERHRAEAELALARRRHREAVVVAHHEVTHQRESVALLEERLLPALRERRRLAQRRQELGSGSVFELVTALRAEVTAARRAAIAVVVAREAEIVVALIAPAGAGSTP